MATVSISKKVRGWWRTKRLLSAGLQIHPVSTLWVWGNYESWGLDLSKIERGCLVYSFGVGRTMDWELEVVRKLGARLHAFDPTPSSVAWMAQQEFPEEISTHSWGLSNRDGPLDVFPPKRQSGENYTQERLRYVSNHHKPIQVQAKRLVTIMAALGHAKIDVLKLDIEGAEFQAVPDFIDAGIRPNRSASFVGIDQSGGASLPK